MKIYYIYTYDGESYTEYKEFFSFEKATECISSLREKHVTAVIIEDKDIDAKHIAILRNELNDQYNKNQIYWNQQKEIDKMNSKQLKDLASNYISNASSIIISSIEKQTGYMYDSIHYAYKKSLSDITPIIDAKIVSTVRGFTILAIPVEDSRPFSIKIPRSLKNAEKLAEELKKLVRELCCERGEL